MMVEDYNNTKKDTFLILFLFSVILMTLFIFSCKPAQIITLTDTITKIEYATKYEKELVRFDSIVTVTDTFDNIVFRDRTVFQTKEHTKIDSIFLDKEIIKDNPINHQLKHENDKLTIKLNNRNRLLLYLGVALLIILGFILVKSKIK